MVDLFTIETIGVTVAAFTLSLDALNIIRVSNEENKKRKIEFTNNIMRTLYTEEARARAHKARISKITLHPSN